MDQSDQACDCQWESDSSHADVEMKNSNFSFFFFSVPSPGQRLKHSNRLGAVFAGGGGVSVKCNLARRAPTRTHQNKSPENKAGRNPGRVALEKTVSVSPGLSVPETAAGGEDEKQFSRAEGAEGAEPRFSRDNLAFQGDKAELISGPGRLRRADYSELRSQGGKSRAEIISDSGGTTLEAPPFFFFFHFIHSITACKQETGSSGSPVQL